MLFEGNDTLKMKMLLNKIFSLIIVSAITMTSMAALLSDITVFAAQTRYEAENASCSGVTIQSGSQYSGGKYVYMRGSGSCTFTVTVSSDGFYDLQFASSGEGADKWNNVLVDGQNVGEIKSLNSKLSISTVKMVYLTSGSHKITVSKNWGWIMLDYLELTQSRISNGEYYNVSKKLINPNASTSAKRLMSFIVDNYGKNVISGQTCDGGINGSEFTAIKNATGKTPAMLGMDLMRYTPNRVAKGDTCKSVENAIAFYNAGGITELCWHWNAPDKYLKTGTDSNGNPRWWGGFYTDNLNIDFSAIMDGTDKQGYNLLMADIDAIAVQLKRLKDADVPILFRPLHEASGGWFWWGSDGSAPYIKLWKLMYDKLTNEYGLNNLIWVWNGQKDSWYPGDDYVDIVGEDIYPGYHVYNPQTTKFLEATKYSSTNKVVAMTENGCLFDIDQAISANALWSWFCVWGGDFCSNGTTISQKYTETAMWKKVYQHARVITLDKMPDLKTYPITEVLGESVTLFSTSKSVIVGQSFDLTPKISPVNSTESPKWTSSNTSIVSVVNGRCVAKNVGIATIKCVLANGKYASCVVNVKPATVTGLARVSKTTTSCTIKWNAVKGAKSYQVYITDSAGKYVKTVTSAGNTVTIPNLASGTTYKFKVRAFSSSLYGNYSSVLLYTTSPTKILGTNVSSFTNKTVTLKWNKVNGAEKYTVYKYDSKTKTYKACKTVTGNYAVIDNLSAGRTYKFKVRALKFIGITRYYGAYSDIVSAITKPSNPAISLKTSSRRFTATWKKITGAEGYQIRYSTSSNFANSKVCYAKGGETLSRTVSSLTSGKAYYVKVRAYKTYNDKKYYGGYSAVRSIKVSR